MNKIINMQIFKILLALIVANNVFANPSFDCNKAVNAVEKAICADNFLSELDKNLAQIYKTAFEILDDSQKQKVKNEQLSWLKNRNKEQDFEYLAENYVDRILEILKNKKISDFYAEKLLHYPDKIGHNIAFFAFVALEKQYKNTTDICNSLKEAIKGFKFHKINPHKIFVLRSEVIGGNGSSSYELYLLHQEGKQIKIKNIIFPLDYNNEINYQNSNDILYGDAQFDLRKGEVSWSSMSGMHETSYSAKWKFNEDGVAKLIEYTEDNSEKDEVPNEDN